MSGPAVPPTLDVEVPGIDPRGPRFTAGLTAVVLVAALLLPTAVATVLVVLQLASFAVGAFRGVQHTPTAWLFRTVVRPRLGTPAELEDPRPPRFAQAIGLGFMVVALAGYLLAPLVGTDLVGEIAVGAALVAALLNALAGLCLGCELYLTVARARAGRPLV